MNSYKKCDRSEGFCKTFPVPPTECMDGFIVSIQASQWTYCQPRDNKGPYTHVELSYPSQAPPDYILPYAKDTDKPCETVYGYVPVPLVEQMILEHGGRKTLSM